MNKADFVKDLYGIIFAGREVYFDLARQIWERPELGFEEHFAVGLQLRLLREWGFRVQQPYADLETAYRAE